jgi:hypothetical protein
MIFKSNQPRNLLMRSMGLPTKLEASALHRVVVKRQLCQQGRRDLDQRTALDDSRVVG